MEKKGKEIHSNCGKYYVSIYTYASKINNHESKWKSLKNSKLITHNYVSEKLNAINYIIC